MRLDLLILGSVSVFSTMVRSAVVHFCVATPRRLPFVFLRIAAQIKTFIMSSHISQIVALGMQFIIRDALLALLLNSFVAFRNGRMTE